MGLLNAIFGTKKSLVNEIARDAEQAMDIWNDYLQTYDEKVIAAKGFMDKPDVDAVARVEKIERFITKELVDIEAEKRKKQELLDDLERLISRKELARLEDLRDAAYWERDVTPVVKKLLGKLFDVLQTQLRVIAAVKKNPKQYNDFKWNLLSLIRETEQEIVRALNTSLTERANTKRLLAVLPKILAAEKVSRLPRRPKSTKPSADAKNAATPIIEDILEDFHKERAKLDDMINDEAYLRARILGHYPRASNDKIKAVMNAVRWKYDHEEFLL